MEVTVVTPLKVVIVMLVAAVEAVVERWLSDMDI